MKIQVQAICVWIQDLDRERERVSVPQLSGDARISVWRIVLVAIRSEHLALFFSTHDTKLPSLTDMRNSEFPKAVLKKIPVFWDMTPCRLVQSYRRLGGAHCVHFRVVQEEWSELPCGWMQRASPRRWHTYKSVRRHTSLQLYINKHYCFNMGLG